MVICPHPVSGSGEWLAVLAPSDSGMWDGMDGTDELHLVARLGVDEHLLHLYLGLVQHPQINILQEKAKSTTKFKSDLVFSTFVNLLDMKYCTAIMWSVFLLVKNYQ
jgi:hypothetical protein